MTVRATQAPHGERGQGPGAAPEIPRAAEFPGGQPALDPGADGTGQLVLAAGGGYGARLVAGGVGWYPERWTLDGPEPYAVPLPGALPESPDSQLLPLADGRVLIVRPSGDGDYHCALLYPSGPDTGEVRLGSVAARGLSLLPPAPDGRRAYALAEVTTDEQEPASEVWLLTGGGRPAGPRLVARLPGHCSGGAWLDRDAGLLALNRTDEDGRTRAVAVPVASDSAAGVLLQIGEESNDRLLLADPDSGLLLIASDAPGEERIGWGVLGSHRPVRFPDSLRPDGVAVLPLAIQPGRTLLPETCGVALRMRGPAGDWVAVWRPQQRALQHFPAPPGWLGGARWTEDGELLLPCVTEQAPCQVARIAVPVPEPSVLSLNVARDNAGQRAGGRHALAPHRESCPDGGHRGRRAADPVREPSAAPELTADTGGDRGDRVVSAPDVAGLPGGGGRGPVGRADREGHGAGPQGLQSWNAAPDVTTEAGRATGVCRPVPLHEAPLPHQPARTSADVPRAHSGAR